MTDIENFNLATADKHQMKYYAKNVLELNLSMSLGEETMREKIHAHCVKHDLEQPKAVLEEKGTGAVRKGGRCIINIAKQEKPGGSDPVFVGVQGVGYTIPRGINIEVPNAVEHVLGNAITDVVTQDPDDGAILHDLVPTFPYNKVQNVA
jgi:hypothetical protein